MASSILRGKSVSDRDVFDAIEKYRQMYPNNDYDSWLDKKTYKWALHYKGQLYPHKYILSLATGMDTSDYIASDSRRVFGNLNFTIIRKP